MLFKDLRRSIKPVLLQGSPTNQRQEGELANIQRVIDEATVANKPSRCQVFELRPTLLSKFAKRSD